jgi:hypothetical protein
MPAEVVVVLGMHKSGTTLVSQILHRSGIEMGEAGDVDGDYDKGVFHERSSFRELNEALLGYGDPAWIHPAPRSLRMSDEHRRRMRDLIEKAGARAGRWGFKDPRTCLTYPLWEEELPPHKAIVVYRAPQEVWQHMNRHPLKRWRVWPAVRSWCDHNLPLIELVESGRRDTLVLSFERLVTSPEEFERLEEFIGVPLDDPRDPRRYRRRARRDALYSMTTAMRRWLGRPEARLIHARLEELRAAQCAERNRSTSATRAR